MSNAIANLLHSGQYKRGISVTGKAHLAQENRMSKIRKSSNIKMVAINLLDPALDDYERAQKDESKFSEWLWNECPWNPPANPTEDYGFLTPLPSPVMRQLQTDDRDSRSIESPWFWGNFQATIVLKPKSY